MFSAAKGWILKFIKLHALRSLSFRGEAVSINISAVASGMIKLCQKLREFDAEFIFNIDRTVLFFKPLPRQTYATELETVKSVRGTKAMTLKNRITAYVFTDDVFDRFSMVVI